MQELLWFLPPWPPVFGDLAVFGALLLAGLLGGELANRLLALPRITGYVLVGIALGPNLLGLVRSPLVSEGRVFIDLALGLVMFELGSRLDFAWLARNRWLAAAALGESMGGFFAIYLALLYAGFSPLLAGCAAAVGTATSPAVVLLVAQELRASGQITERMLLFTAVNCAVAFVALTLLLPVVHLENRADWRAALLHPLYVLLGAALLGFAACRLTLWLARWLGKREDRQFVLQVGMIVLVVGLARAAGVTVGVRAARLRRAGAQPGRRPRAAAAALRLRRPAAVRGPVRADRGEPRFQPARAGRRNRRGLRRRALPRQGSRDPRFRPALGPAPRRRRAAGDRAAADVGARGGDGVRHRGAVPGASARGSPSVVLSAVALLELLGPLATQFALRRSGEADAAERTWA